MKKLISLILCLCMLAGMALGSGMAAGEDPGAVPEAPAETIETAEAAASEPEAPAEEPVLAETAETPTEAVPPESTPSVGTVTMTITLSDNNNASFNGGAKTATISVYKGGSLLVWEDEEGNYTVRSTYDGRVFFSVPFSLADGYGAYASVMTNITADGSYTLNICPVHTVTFAVNAANRGGLSYAKSTIEIFHGSRFYQPAEDDCVAYNSGGLGSEISPEPADGYRFDHWEGLPADETVTGDFTVTAVFVPIADIQTAETTNTSVSEDVDKSTADSTDMSKASVTGVKEALEDNIVEYLINAGLSEPDAKSSETQVQVHAAVNVTLTQGSRESLTFSLKPTADITKNGVSLATGAAIANTYFNKPMTVVIPCGDIVPDKIEHRSAEGTLLETFTADGDPAFTYDGTAKTVTLQVTEFSSLTLIAAHSHDGVTFTPLDSFTGGELTTGNYYLTEDLALTKSITIAAGETVNLCLNGHTIDVQGKGRGFSVKGTLTLCDCGTTGSVTDGEATFGGGAYVYDGGSMTLKSGSLTANAAAAAANPGRGGGVYVDAGGSFTMTGGRIESCRATGSGGGEGSGVYVKAGGSFTMTGGSITNCTISYSHGNFYGAVYVAPGSTVTLGGSARIDGNLTLQGTKQTESKSNLYIANGAAVTVASGAAAPAQGMSVGVTLADGMGAFTGTNAADYSRYFFSDDSTKHVEYDSGTQKLKIAEGHVHDGITFTPLDQAKLDTYRKYWGGSGIMYYYYTLPAGSYYLTEDLSLSPTAGNYFYKIRIKEGTTVNICLNGKKLNLNNGNIKVEGTLNLYDCSASASGTIENTCNDNAICISPGGSFTMSGGTVTNSHRGIWLYSGGSCTLGGNAKVIGNTNANVYVSTGAVITVQTGFTGKAGVTLESHMGAFTGANTADYSQYFSSDNGSYVVYNSGTDNVLKLLKPAPTADDFSYDKAIGMIYNGQGKNDAYSIAALLDGIGAITTKIYDSNGNPVEGKPVNAGTYTLKLDVAESADYAGVTDLTDPGWTFSIAPKSISSATIEMDHARYLAREYGAEPWPTVKDGDTELDWYTDYELSYANNTQTGTATMTVTGVGNYTGTLTKEFEVVALEDAGEATGFDDYTEGEAKADGVLTLGEGTELTLDYVGNVFVTLDGEELTEQQGKAEDGCIRVTVYKKTLNRLKAGKHVLRVEIPELTMAYALDFTVHARPADTDETDTVAKTGDDSRPLLWLGLMVLCAAGLTAGVCTGKKRKES